jgi:hypothetical protein
VLATGDGATGIGSCPSFRLRLMIERSAGPIRTRAEARQGHALEQRLGGEDARHRKADGERYEAMCQRNCLVQSTDEEHGATGRRRRDTTK